MEHPNCFFSHDYEKVLIGAFLQDSNTYRYLQSLDLCDMHASEHMEILCVMKELLAARRPLTR